MHCWAPTVLGPDGKPFDKKLIKVLLGLPTVNVLIIALLYGDKILVYLGVESVVRLLLGHILDVRGDIGQVRGSGGSNMFSS